MCLMVILQAGNKIVLSGNTDSSLRERLLKNLLILIDRINVDVFISWAFDPLTHAIAAVDAFMHLGYFVDKICLPVHVTCLHVRQFTVTIVTKWCQCNENWTKNLIIIEEHLQFLCQTFWVVYKQKQQTHFPSTLGTADMGPGCIKDGSNPFLKNNLFEILP